jgi:cell division protein FtsW (lipid II flippase)
MQAFKKIQDYTEAVCDQVRWKQAHATIAEEMENHIIDQRDAYISDGMDEAAATQKAIAQMGDHITVGALLDRTHRPRPQWGMISLTAALLLMGFVIRIMIGSDEHWAVTILSAMIGLGLMTAAYCIDFTLIGKYPKTVYFVILGVSIGALFLRKSDAGLISLVFPLGFAAVVYAARNKGYWGIVACGLSILLPSFIVASFPYVSGFLLSGVSGLVILCIAISRGWFGVKKVNGYLLVGMSAATIVSLVILSISPGSYRWERLRLMFNPAIDPNGVGYTGAKIRALLGGASLFGQGDASGETLQGWLNHNTADYLFTYIIHHMGWFAFILIMGVLLFFISKSIALCVKQRSGLALFVSVSVILAFTMQAVFYVLINLTIVQISAISLPLISQGNMATVINLMLIGVMLSAFRTGDIVRDRYLAERARSRFITWNDGKLTISISKK